MEEESIPLPRSNSINSRKSMDMRGMNGVHVPSSASSAPPTPQSTLTQAITSQSSSSDQNPSQAQQTGVPSLTISIPTTPSSSELPTPVAPTQPVDIPSSTSAQSVAYETTTSESTNPIVPASPSLENSPNPSRVPPQVPKRITYNTHLSSSQSHTPIISPETPTTPATPATPSTLALSNSGIIPDSYRNSSSLPSPSIQPKQKHLDLHDHTIEIFLKTQISYCSNLQLIVEVIFLNLFYTSRSKF